jgi:hypothetical protein
MQAIFLFLKAKLAIYRNGKNYRSTLKIPSSGADEHP